ncbi:MAG: PAS domain S-box protein [Thermodesulfovibrionales bacterium]
MSNILKILHLEDNPNDVELVRETIISQGIDVEMIVADTRSVFVDALEKGNYDLILADYTLPSFDGLSALDIVREKFSQLPFIFVTGTMGEEKAVETLKRGATDYVLKNNLSRLVPSIMRALREAQEHIDRKKAQEALEESEERFKAVFDNAVDGILLADVENKKFLLNNSMICQMLGYTEEEMKELAVKDIHPEAALPSVIEQFEKQTRGDFKLAKGTPMMRKDGSVFYADINAFPITLSGKTYLVGIFRDITERKEAEEEIQKRVKELEDFYDMAIGRELRMIELKEEIENLKEELAKYKI